MHARARARSRQLRAVRRCLSLAAIRIISQKSKLCTRKTAQIFDKIVLVARLHNKFTTYCAQYVTRNYQLCCCCRRRSRARPTQQTRTHQINPHLCTCPLPVRMCALCDHNNGRARAFAGDVATMMTPADLVANQTNARAAPMARRRLLDRWRRSHSRRRHSRTRRSTPYTIRAALQRASTLRPRLT